MIASLHGKLIVKDPLYAIIECGGVGFKVQTSNNTLFDISGEKTATVYTHLNVREDALDLFGFSTEMELEWFRMLISVNGVGPKAAMAILSCFSPEQFALAVCTEDRKAIAKANGIGPKTAARIILELRDKMMSEGTFPSTSAEITASPTAPAATGANGNMNEAQEALLVLGYSRSEILGALHTIDTSAMGVEDIIRAALKKLMR